MSTMTLRKRIALVAVSALTAGLVSVVAAPSANAAHGDISNTFASGTVGVVSSAMTSATTTKTAVLLSTGQLVLTLDGATSGDALYTTVSAGAAITAASAGTISNDQASHTEAASATSTYTITVKPTGAIGSTFTVSTYATDASTTVINKLTVTIAGASLSGTVVPANSFVNWTTNGSTTSTVEDASKASGTTGNPLYIYVQLRDAYKANVTSTSGALIATASAGAVVKIAGSGLNTTGNAATAVSTDSPAALYISVAEATAGAGWNGTVTVTYNGVTIATKTGKISGQISKLTVTAKKIGKNDGSANVAALGYQASDAAGNNVVLDNTKVLFSSSTNPALVSAAVGSADNTTSTEGSGTFTCANSTALTGKADIVLQTTLADGTVIKSNAVTVQCGGAASTYTAAFDKAKYVQGDIATMTISFLDVRGAVANSYDAVANSTPDQAITTNQMERVTAHAASAKPDVNGQIKYTFTVGTSTGVVAGAYNAVVSLPTLNAISGTKATNQTVSYTIDGGTAVSNADVLKAIVSLIASINKQIAALQKALLRR
jgi:hypothetical protein